MRKIVTKILDKTFVPLQQFWDSKQVALYQSMLLIAVFTFCMAVSLVNHYKIFALPSLLGQIHFLQSIEISFTILLFFEMVSLVFVIPQSIANSIGKQIEILSLILLRSSFKEFSHYEFTIPIQNQLESVFKMVSDGMGSLIIFLLLSYYYGMQRHKSITLEEDKIKFLQLKQVIAMMVLIALTVLQISDILHMVNFGSWKQSVDQFYMILIFADLLFMLAAFRYSLHYPDIFRYSAFVLVTVFIRLSLMAPVYYNALIGIFSCIFAIGIVAFHNIFNSGHSKFINKSLINK